MTKEAPTAAEIFSTQIAVALGFKNIDDMARTITIGRAVQDYVAKLAPTPTAGLAAPRFEKVCDKDGKHVITHDLVNGLEWEITDFGGKTFTFDQAKKACAELRTGGHADWRLPTIQELLSLVDYEKSSPACDRDAFPNTNTDYYYRTSTPYAPGSGCAWGVVFNYGFSYGLYHDDDNYVRAVRASQS